MTMASAKTATLSFRIEPRLKDALRAAAELEHRSVANMIEVMIRDYCDRAGIDQSEQPAAKSHRQERKPTQRKLPRTRTTR